MLGEREPDIYGTITLENINTELLTLAKELNVVCWSSFDGANTFNGLIKEADAVFIHTAHTSHQITEMASKFQNLRMINVPGGYSGMLTAIRAYLKEQ